MLFIVLRKKKSNNRKIRLFCLKLKFLSVEQQQSNLKIKVNCKNSETQLLNCIIFVVVVVAVVRANITITYECL